MKSVPQPMAVSREFLAPWHELKKLCAESSAPSEEPRSVWHKFTIKEHEFAVKAQSATEFRSPNANIAAPAQERRKSSLSRPRSTTNPPKPIQNSPRPISRLPCSSLSPPRSIRQCAPPEPSQLHRAYHSRKPQAHTEGRITQTLPFGDTPPLALRHRRTAQATPCTGTAAFMGRTPRLSTPAARVASGKRRKERKARPQ